MVNNSPCHFLAKSSWISEGPKSATASTVPATPGAFRVQLPNPLVCQLECVIRTPRGPVQAQDTGPTPEFLGPQAWGRAWQAAVLATSQVMLLLLLIWGPPLWEPQVKLKGPTKHLPTMSYSCSFTSMIPINIYYLVFADTLNDSQPKWIPGPLTPVSDGVISSKTQTLAPLLPWLSVIPLHG